MTIVLTPIDLHAASQALRSDAPLPSHLRLAPIPAAAEDVDAAALVVAPADDHELQAALASLREQSEPALVLLGGPEVRRVHGAEVTFAPGRGSVLLEGTDLCILTCGAQVGEALAAAMDLSTQSMRPRVVSLPSLRPLDDALVQRCARECAALLVVEAPAATGSTPLHAAVTAALAGADAPPLHHLTESRVPAGEDDEGEPAPFGPKARDIRVQVMQLWPGKRPVAP